MGLLLSGAAGGWRGLPLRGGLAMALGAGLVVAAGAPREEEPLRIGVLHSLTGAMAVSERALLDAVTLAVEELNAGGGVLGRRIETVVADAASDADVAAREAERLIAAEGVQAVFGCWTSTCRRTVRPVVERHDHLLFYPLQFEGLEESSHLVYVGATPSQQILPALRWALAEHGPRVFLVGSDYVFPRTANEIIRDALRQWRGEVAGEAYLPLDATEAEIAAVAARIAAARPDVVLNTINGSANAGFFRLLRQAEEAEDAAEALPVLSFSVGEEEIRQMDGAARRRHYAAWSYFQSIDSPANQHFVERYRERFGADRVVNDPIESAYAAVHLWAEAARRAGSARPARVRAAIGGVSIAAPGGMLYVDPRNRHVWKNARIGRVRPDGQFEIVWSSRAPLRPRPYPALRTEQAWRHFLDSLHTDWGGWTAPAPR